MDRTIAENGVLDQAEGDAGKAGPNMGAARDGDAAAMRNDLHQRFSSDGQLLDLKVAGRSLEASHQVSLREVTGRQMGHHKVPIPQVIPLERLLIGEWVAV
jgi:hypothetical protein